MMIDTNLSAPEDTELAAEADALAAKLDDEPEPEPADTDEQPEPEPITDKSTAKAQAPEPAAIDPKAVREQLRAAVANDQDLAIAQRPDLWAQFAQENPHEYIRWRARAEQK